MNLIIIDEFFFDISTSYLYSNNHLNMMGKVVISSSELLFCATFFSTDSRAILSKSIEFLDHSKMSVDFEELFAVNYLISNSFTG